MLSGCAQRVLQPSINDATLRLLGRHGVEVIIPKAEGCCGALVHHMGREEAAHNYARANIDAWIAEMDGHGLDAILIKPDGVARKQTAIAAGQNCLFNNFLVAAGSLIHAKIGSMFAFSRKNPPALQVGSHFPRAPPCSQVLRRRPPRDKGHAARDINLRREPPREPRLLCRTDRPRRCHSVFSIKRHRGHRAHRTVNLCLCPPMPSLTARDQGRR